MKIYTGTDIIEISRIKKSIDCLGELFKNKIYTFNEIEYCESKKNAKYQHYAARFAAKEAIYKAISNVLENKFDSDWQDVEIINDEKGKPNIRFINTKLEEKIKDIDISISHCREYAVASVIVIVK